MALSYESWWVSWVEGLGRLLGVVWRVALVLTILGVVWRVALVLTILGAIVGGCYGCGLYLKWVMH
jgi:hypothetical protein